MDPNIVILAGGMSSRMKNSHGTGLDPALLREAEEKPKAMIGLGGEGRPFLDYLLMNIASAGYRDVVIVVNDRDRSIREYYDLPGRGDRFPGLSLTYAVQTIPAGRTKPLGTADALWCALASKPEWSVAKVTVCNCDNLYSVEALRCLRESSESCAMIEYDRDALGFEGGRVERFAVVEKEGEYLRSIVEKPTPDVIHRTAGESGRIGVSMNIWRFSTEVILPYLESEPLHPARQEKELPSAVMRLVSDNPRAVRVYPRAERVPDLTEKGDIERIRTYLKGEERPFSL